MKAIDRLIVVVAIMFNISALLRANNNNDNNRVDACVDDGCEASACKRAKEDACKTRTDGHVKEDKRLSEGNYFNSSLSNSLVLYTK